MQSLTVSRICRIFIEVRHDWDVGDNFETPLLTNRNPELNESNREQFRVTQ